MSSFIHSYLCINRDKTNYIPTTMQYAIFLQTHNLVDLVQARRSNCYNAVEQLYHFFVSIHDFWQQLLIPYCLFALCMKDQNSVCKAVNKGPAIRKFKKKIRKLKICMTIVFLLLRIKKKKKSQRRKSFNLIYIFFLQKRGVIIFF